MQHTQAVKGPLLAALFAVLAILFAGTVALVTDPPGEPAAVVAPARVTGVPSTTSSSTTTTSTTTTTVAPPVLPAADSVPLPDPGPVPVAEAPQEPAIQPSSPGGGHSDAWWMGVAVCEQGGRNDPFFGYFSFMDGSQGGQPWAEQVAAGNAVLARSGSESPAWAPACVAAGYAASPSG